MTRRPVSETNCSTETLKRLLAFAAPAKLDSLMPEFVRDNAGKAFEFMVDSVDEERKAAGLISVQDMFAGESPVRRLCVQHGELFASRKCCCGT